MPLGREYQKTWKGRENSSVLRRVISGKSREPTEKPLEARKRKKRERYKVTFLNTNYHTGPEGHDTLEEMRTLESDC